MDDDDQEELRCTGSDVEIEEYTDTEESPYAAYQSTDKLFDTDQPGWQKFSFLATLTTLVMSVTIAIISFPLYLESVSATSNAYAGRTQKFLVLKTFFFFLLLFLYLNLSCLFLRPLVRRIFCSVDTWICSLRCWESFATSTVDTKQHENNNTTL